MTTDSKSNVSWMVDDGESKGKNLLFKLSINIKKYELKSRVQILNPIGF